MTTTIAETRIRAQVQEYDGVAYVYIEAREATAWEWKRVATFSHDSQHEALEWAREAGWAWLLGAEPALDERLVADADADETARLQASDAAWQERERRESERNDPRDR